MEDILREAQDTRNLIEILGRWGLLAKEGVLKCPNCGGFMKLVKDRLRKDEHRWACLNKVSKQKKKAFKCSTFQMIRKNTFFEKSNLSLKQILVFAHLWIYNVELEVIELQTRISKSASVDWNSFCYEVVIDFGFRREKPIGGENMTVEIAESKFGKRKYHRIHNVEDQWVFGGVCIETGDVFLVPVEHRDASTLKPLIEKWIVPGSTIISDCWKAYDGLDEAAFRDLKINHSVNFKDPETSAYSNTIESLWRHTKEKLPEYNSNMSLFTGDLAKFLFVQFCKTNKLDPTMEFFKSGGELYNPYNVGESSTAVKENLDIREYSEGESSTAAVASDSFQNLHMESPVYIDYEYIYE